jgi:hypothetical protein
MFFLKIGLASHLRAKAPNTPGLPLPLQSAKHPRTPPSVTFNQIPRASLFTTGGRTGVLRFHRHCRRYGRPLTAHASTAGTVVPRTRGRRKARRAPPPPRLRLYLSVSTEPFLLGWRSSLPDRRRRSVRHRKVSSFPSLALPSHPMLQFLPILRVVVSQPPRARTSAAAQCAVHLIGEKLSRGLAQTSAPHAPQTHMSALAFSPSPPDLCDHNSASGQAACPPPPLGGLSGALAPASLHIE